MVKIFIYCNKYNILFLLYFGSNKCRLGELKTLLLKNFFYKFYCLKHLTGSVYIVTVFALSLSIHCVAHVCFVFSRAVSAVSSFPAFQFPATVLDIWDIAPTMS